MSSEGQRPERGRRKTVRLCRVGLGWYARRAHLPALAALEQQSSKKQKHRRKATSRTTHTRGSRASAAIAATAAGGAAGVEGTGGVGAADGERKEAEIGAGAGVREGKAAAGAEEAEGGGEGEGGFKIVAICSSSSESHAAAERILGHAVKHHTNLEQVWQDPDIDVVDLVVPIPAMAGAVAAALKAGKHVISEKPVAESLEVRGWDGFMD